MIKSKREIERVIELGMSIIGVRNLRILTKEKSRMVQFDQSKAWNMSIFSSLKA